MIDLSHLTEEEQGMIMTVLRRDADLKKAEEERVRKLERVLTSESESESENKLKYLSGEWFYEAKSRRHMDTIHGSEIILAAIKHKRGSVRSDRSRTSSSRGSDIVAPPKPARCLELLQLRDNNHFEEDNVNVEVSSPRTPRRNPFNRASLVVVETPENNDHASSTETEVKPHTVSSQTSQSSVPSQNSTLGFKPVPKKRTFVSRRRSSQPDVNGLQGAEFPLRQTRLVPAPRPSVRRGSGSGSGSGLKSSEEKPDQGSVPDFTAQENSHQPPGHVSQESSNSSVDREKQRSVDFCDSRAAVDEGGDLSPQRETTPTSNEEEDQTFRVQDSDSVATTERHEDLSLTQSIVDPDPPVSYDLNYIEKSNQQTQKKTKKKNVFTLSTQASSPTGDGDSIAKVLDWFSRSLDSLDFVGTEDEPQRSTKTSNRREDTSRDVRDKDTVDFTESDTQRQANVANEIRASDRTGNKEPRTQEMEHEDNQTSKISHLKTFWETKNAKNILTHTSSNRGQTVSSEEDDEDEIRAHAASEIHSAPGINNEDKDMEDNVHVSNKQQDDSLETDSLSQRNEIHSQRLKLASCSRPDRRSSDAEILSERTDLQSRESPDLQSRESPDLQSRESPDSQSIKSNPQQQSQPDTDVQPNPESLDSERLHMEQNDTHNSSKLHRSSGEDTVLSPKRKDVSNKDRADTAERIKQLKSFWEQERNKPIFYSPPTPDDGKVPRGSNLQKLNKRFTKSEYDLRSVGHEDQDTDEEDFDRNHYHFNVRPLNQGLDKMSPTLSTSRSQFNTLREFWDEATSETKSSVSFDKPKSPKRKEPSSFQEMNDIYRLSVAEKTRPAVMKTPPSPQSRTKPRPETSDRNKASNFTTTESRRSSKDSEKPLKPQTRSPKSRRDSFTRSSGSGSSLRRSTSMFALSAAEEQDPDQFLMDLSPAHFQSRKQRQNAEKGAKARRSSEGTDVLTPRARAFVPSDYRHYLGMTANPGVHTSPATDDDVAAAKPAFEFDLNAPIRASTPLTAEERHTRKAKANQRPLWPNYSSSDTGQESSVSSASETWTTSRISFNREKDDDGQNPVKKALRRAEAWPKTKSIEDITSPSLSSRDRNKDSTEQRRVSDASSVPSPSSSLSLDPEHLKKMSKSVPSFLQQEDEDRDVAESPYYEDIFLKRSSMTNLTHRSSGMASLSSLSGSIMTMYSGDFGNVDVQGNIQFSINYINKLREFHIFVAECQDLAAVDPKRRRSDPYVKSYLVPDKANLGKRKTSVKKKTLHPKFNEILRYRVRMEYLRTQTLILSVWHHDTFGRNSFLGEVDVDLSTWDFDHTHMNYLDLKARTTPTPAPSSGRGEMKLAIRFLPQISHSEGVAKDGPNTGEVHIWVKECRNLPLIRATIDPYVKCFVLPDTSRKSRQKTRVLRRTTDPVFNHTMVYDGISDSDLAEACVELTVWDRDRLASHLLGGVRLGVGTGKSYGAPVSWMDSTVQEVALWDQMMASPDEWVESLLPLRTVHSAKTAFK
uniref:synaptotagmin-like protein 2 isoform X2 n=1 Tax=Solea senegalensis TaxID=28829 RepID=UPI001CD83084|nr:synaptotagmin-like protein 2 isoform X2 [Solea senegalensis]